MHQSDDTGQVIKYNVTHKSLLSVFLLPLFHQHRPNRLYFSCFPLVPLQCGWSCYSNVAGMSCDVILCDTNTTMGHIEVMVHLLLNRW